jgi:hypothetical protein
MLEILSNDALYPFLLSAAMVVALVLLELAFLTIGINTEIGSADTGLDALDADLGLDATASAGEATYTSMGGVLDIFGLRNMPVTAWLAFLAASFSGIGLAGQFLAEATLGAMLPPVIAASVAAVPALIVTKFISKAVSRLLPRETTSVISEASFKRRIGLVTVGTARRGHPAQVGFTDQHGNFHYLMAEPLDDGDEIGEGAEVFITRTPRGDLRLVKIG